MRLASLSRKSLLETLRDWKILILTLTLAPSFVALVAAYFDHAPERYRILILDRDEGADLPGGGRLRAGRDLVSALTGIRSVEGTVILEVETERDLETARRRIAERSADLALEIPPDFSRVLAGHGRGSRPPPATIRTHGDPSNVKSVMAGAWCDTIALRYAAAITGQGSPVAHEAKAVAGSRASLTDFDLYVPPLLALALMMIMFTAAAALIREKDKRTIVRLRISRMRVWEWLLAESLTQVVVGLLALALTFATAVAVGYETSGSVAVLMVVGLLSSLAVMAISVVVAAFTRTVFDLMTVGCFPFFILMFFSGGMLPLPELRLFALGGRTVNLNDLLPTTHSISAFNRILNHDAGLGDVAFELGAMAVLTALFFAGGTALFTRRHMRAA